MAEKSVAPERSKTTTAKAKAKTQVGTRTRVTVTKAKDIVDEEAVRVVRPQKAEKTKRKLEVLTTEEAEDMEEEEERGMVESARDSPAVIEVLSSPMEPPEVILPKRTLISQVTSQQVFFQFLSLYSRFSYRGANRFMPGTCRRRRNQY